MAIVPVSTPSVESRGVGLPVQQVNAPAEAFGALQGQALVQGGAKLASAGHEMNQIATDMAIQADTRGAKDSVVGTADQTRDAGYGPNGYYRKNGQDAVSGLADYNKSLDDIKQKGMEGLSPRAANLYLNSIGPQIEAEKSAAARFAMQQGKVADLGSSQARIRSSNDDATVRWNDPAALARSTAAITGEMQTQAAIHGWTPDETAEQTKIALSKTYSDTIRAAAASGDVATAAEILKKFRPQMDAQTNISLTEHLRPKLMAAQATAEVSREIAGVGGSAGDPFSANIAVESGGNQFGPDGNALTSPKGAIGRSQILPTTAEETASKHGIVFDPDRLRKDGAYNERLGRLYHSDLMTKYDGNKVLADAAYNAGPGRVDEWLTTIGDPRKGEISTPDFATSIPFKETRDYVVKTGAAAGHETDMVHPDFSGAADRLLAKHADDPEYQGFLMSRLNAQKAQYELRTKTERETIQKSANDTIAALQAGKDDVEIPYASIRRVFDPPVAEALLTKMEEARTDGQILQGVQWATPDQINEMRAGMASGMGWKAAMPGLHGKKLTQPAEGEDNTPTEVQGFAQRQKERAQVEAVIARRDKMIADDPAAYVRSQPDVAAAYANAKDADGLQNAIDKSMIVQRSLGVEEPRALSNNAIAAEVKRLHTTDPEKGDMGAELDAMEKQYGPHWQDAMHDLVKVGKLNPAFQALSVMDQPSQIGARQDLQRALQLQAEAKGEFGKSVPWDQKTALAHGIDDNLANFQATTRFGGGRMFDEVVKPAVTALATFYAGQGIDGSTAAQRAYDAVIGSKYDMDGSTRTPKGMMGAVQAAGYGVTSGLKPEDLSPNSATVAEARAGQWVTTPDGKGVALVAKSVKTGGYLPVRKADGSLLTLDFSNLPKGSYDAQTGMGTGIGGLN